MKIRKSVILLVILALVFGMSACDVQEGAVPEENSAAVSGSGVIIDRTGRQVEVPEEVVGTQERGDALLTFIDACKADLTKRTEGYPEEEKPVCYPGAVTFSGRHGFCGTYANFGPFLAVGAKNVSDTVAGVNYFETDFEQVLVWDPDIIFLDPGNMDLVNEEYAANPAYFHSVRAIQEGNVYTMPSFNNAGTNITYCLMNGYWTVSGSFFGSDHGSGGRPDSDVHAGNELLRRHGAAGTVLR